MSENSSIQTGNEIVRLLHQFESQIGQGEREEAAATLDRVVSLYNKQRTNERVDVERARHARQITESAEEQAELSRFIRRTSRASVQRGELLTTGSVAIEDADAVKEAELSETIDRSIEAESELTEVEQAAVEHAAAVEVPASIVLSETAVLDDLSEVEPGDSFWVAVTVANAGDQPAEEVVVAIDEPSGLKFRRREFSIGQIAGGEESNKTIKVQVESTGTFDADVSVSAAVGGADSGTLSVTIPDPSILDSVGQTELVAGVTLDKVALAGAATAGLAYLANLLVYRR